MKAVKVEVWFDHYTKCWVAEAMTEEGFQVGEANYTHTKKEAIEYAKEYKLPIVKYNKQGEIQS